MELTQAMHQGETFFVYFFDSPLIDEPGFGVSIRYNGRDQHNRKIWLASLYRVGVSEPLFEDFRVSAHDWKRDPKYFALLALDGMTLKPGDTDEEFFDDYTQEQLEWANSDTCEALACEVMIELEENYERS